MNDPSPQPSMGSPKLTLCFVLLLLFTVALKIPSLRVPHAEYDERIYVTLAQQLYENGTYTLRGTSLLFELAPEMYDRPLFFQPPLFVILSIPLVLNFGNNSAVVLSWIGHLLILLALFLFLKKLIGHRPLSILLVLALAATDPILFFASKKIWIDPLAAGFGALSCYLFWRACREGGEKPKLSTFVYSGLLLGAAILTKVPSVLLGPFFALYYLRHYGKKPLREQARVLSATLVPALALSLPWFILTFSYYGKLIDTPILPDLLIETNPYIKMVINRPPYYYLKEIALMLPLLLLPLGYTLIRISRVSFLTLACWTTLLSVIGGYTAFAVLYGQAYVMRYLCLIGLPVYLLIGLYLENRLGGKSRSQTESPGPEGNLVNYTLFFLALIMNSMLCFFVTDHYQTDDLFSLFEMMKAIR